MIQALILSATGILVVFFVLITIAILVHLLGRLDAGWISREAQESEHALEKQPTIDNTTLVLISAAVATVLQGRGRIRRIRHLGHNMGDASNWSVQGRLQVQGSHALYRKRDRK